MDEQTPRSRHSRSTGTPALGGDSNYVRIGGNVGGQVAVGTHITQINAPGDTTPVTEADRAAIADLVAELRRTVADAAPPEQRDAAVGQVDELGEAVLAGEPDPGRMSDIWRWFGVNLPRLATTVKNTITNPLIAKIVAAAGDVAADQFKALFG